MLKHAAPAVDGLAVLAPAPIAVDAQILATAAALLGMEMAALVVLIYGRGTTIAPNHCKSRAFVLSITHTLLALSGSRGRV